MVAQPASTLARKAVAIAGAVLTPVGLVAGYVDIGTNFRFEFLSDSFDYFAWASLVGVLLSFVGLIGWARKSGRSTRVLMAVLAFVFPWAILFLGYPVDGTNMHGPAGGAMMMMIPASILALVLLPMAASAPPSERSR